MTDYLQLLAAFLATVNPPAVALAGHWLDREGISQSVRRRIAALGWVASAALVVVLAVAADSLLDALDIAPETFRIAAGIVMLTVAAGTIFRARVPVAPGEGRLADAVFPVAIPLLCGPATLIAVASYSADEGIGRTIAAALPCTAVAAALLPWPARRWAPAADGVARVLGGLLAIVAAGLIVQGVRDI